MFYELFGRTLPIYGSLITLGGIIANAVALLLIKTKKLNLDIDYLFVLEGYCLMGAFIGAKGLYILVSFNDIQWSRITETAYLNAIMQGGFVFYGGMIGGLLFVLMAGRIHKIEAMEYIKRLICFIPFIHAFGRIGCYKVGCCHGAPYEGPFAVVYGEGLGAPAGVSLFPVQLVEAVMLFVISFVLMILTVKKKTDYTLPGYFILYGITRFLLEYLRGDEIRGIYASFSTSQWISLVLIIIGVILIIKDRRKNPKKVEIDA